MLGVNAHEPLDFIGLGCQDCQCLFNGLDQLGEFSEISVMSSFGLHLLPQVFDRVVIG